MQIAIPLFDRFTVLDAIGPYEVLSRLPGATVTFVGQRTGGYHDATGHAELVAHATLADVPSPGIIVVPGGPGVRATDAHRPLVEWIRAVHPRTTWTTSVCTGALLLGAAGVLAGLEATTHWLELERLVDFGAIPSSQRVVVQGKVVTAAGVSAGVDMALTLAARVAGETVAKAIQLAIEYDPAPPFDSGSPAKAAPEMVRAARERAAARRTVPPPG
jgi:transcriptional regulator GlxA family with amidase domain